MGCQIDQSSILAKPNVATRGVQLKIKPYKAKPKKKTKGLAKLRFWLAVKLINHQYLPNQTCRHVDSWSSTTDISQYRLLFGSLCYIQTVFRLNFLTAQLSYEGRAAVEGANYYF
jgi:hypothetical protein